MSKPLLMVTRLGLTPFSHLRAHSFFYATVVGSAPNNIHSFGSFGFKIIARTYIRRELFSCFFDARN
jgi:hypothetical protein